MNDVDQTQNLLIRPLWIRSALSNLSILLYCKRCTMRLSLSPVFGKFRIKLIISVAWNGQSLNHLRVFREDERQMGRPQ